MRNNNEMGVDIQKINNEIIKHKLKRIVDSELKVTEYKKLFDSIKENVILKYSKNIISNFFITLLGLSIIGLIGLSFIYFFPNELINLLKSDGELITKVEENEFLKAIPYIIIFLIIVASFLYAMSILLRKNNEKRNKLFDLSKLLNDVIEYMDNSVEDEKRKYEYFVDSLEEKDNN